MINSRDQETDHPTEAAPRRHIRWWPVPVILVLAAGAMAWVWQARERQHADRNVGTAIIGLITLLLLLLWCLFLSRLGRRIRFGVLGAVVAVILLGMALFRFHGVTGDMLPILQWRWERPTVTSRPDQTKPTASTALAPRAQLTNDWPQFLGPRRNSTVEQPNLVRDWKAQVPQQLWLHPVGAGWSGFAVAGNRAITQEQRGEDETVVCYDLLSGGPLWSYAYPAHFRSSLGGEGPRATPTIAGQRVYALGSTGILNCLDLETGKLLWSKDTLQDNRAKLNEWGMSSSPLVVNDLVVVSVGGQDNRSLVAYRAGTGDFVWGGGNAGAGYSSPCLVTLAGTAQILIFNAGGVFAHDPTTGTNLWQYRWPGGHPHVSMPIIVPGDRLLVSSGYSVGSELLQVQKDSSGTFHATRVWKSSRLKAKFTNLVYRDGFIYGLDDGVMVCLDASSGGQKWKEGRYGHGQEILAKDVLLVGAESGEVVLLDPNPQAARELARFPALTSKTWNPPALAGAYLLVRNEKAAACYRLPLAQP
jgi:outer membrane protein assembly factor BamB